MSVSPNFGPWVSYAPRRSSNGSKSLSREASGTGHLQDRYPASQTILFVDDEPSILTVRRLIFEVLGFSVLTAESGEEALEVLRSNAVDAVVLDYLMPGMDGEETARRIRGMRADLPIILSSECFSIPQRVSQLVSASVNKGVQQELLLEVLEQQLQHLPIQRSAQETAWRA
jgi:CheY-like chemotaxis protein